MTIGLDISTSVIGIAIFNDNNKLIDLHYLKFKNVKNEENDFGKLYRKLDEFIAHMDQYKSLPIKHISIEAPLKRFQGKFSNADTLQKLTTINALICGYLYTLYNVRPSYYNVNTARKIVYPSLKIPKGTKNKKYFVWEKVVESEPQINWKYSKKTHKLATENFDMSDAYVVGVAHLKTIKKDSIEK